MKKLKRQKPASHDPSSGQSAKRRLAKPFGLIARLTPLSKLKPALPKKEPGDTARPGKRAGRRLAAEAAAKQRRLDTLKQRRPAAVPTMPAAVVSRPLSQPAAAKPAVPAALLPKLQPIVDIRDIRPAAPLPAAIPVQTKQPTIIQDVVRPAVPALPPAPTPPSITRPERAASAVAGISQLRRPAARQTVGYSRTIVLGRQAAIVNRAAFNK